MNANTGTHFTDAFGIESETLEEYGAFNVSLISDLPLFVDPFLLFNSEREEYQQLHSQIIGYLKFLRDKSAEGKIDCGLLRGWFTFSEVKQNWLGYSEAGNSGSGLGLQFAHALNNNLHDFFANFGEEEVTKGSHLEKLTLIEGKVGRDNISDFATNLVKCYLLEYTQTFAQKHINSEFRRRVSVERVRFNYGTEAWESSSFDLPWYGEGYVLLTPKDILTKDENWISREDLMGTNYDEIVSSVPNYQLRAQINNYFNSILPEDHNAQQVKEARANTVRKFPQLVEHYIRYKEDRGDEAEAYSDQKVIESERLYISQVRLLIEELLDNTNFYNRVGNTHQEARDRVMFLKDVIENKGGHRLFYDNEGTPIRRESDLQLLFRLTWSATTSNVSREVNDGRGPVDFEVSRGKFDKSLVEFKLASNKQLSRNLQKQVEVYKAASDSQNALKVIIFFTESERNKVIGILEDVGLDTNQDVILIDGRNDNKPSGSKAA